MAIPDFIVELRKKIGRDLLWLPAVTAVVVRQRPDGMPEVLLVESAEDRSWSPVTGIIDPGEQPAAAAVREVFEETGIVAEAQSLVRVESGPPKRHANRDRAQYLDLTFRMNYVSGEPCAADDEVLNALWCHVDHLPCMAGEMDERIEAAVINQPAAAFSL